MAKPSDLLHDLLHMTFFKNTNLYIETQYTYPENPDLNPDLYIVFPFFEDRYSLKLISADEVVKAIKKLVGLFQGLTGSSLEIGQQLTLLVSF